MNRAILTSCIRNRRVLPLLLLLLPALPSNRLLAQNFSTLYYFIGNSDGGNPRSGLTLIDTTLYGTTHYDGDFRGFGGALGTVFSLSTDGTGFKAVFTFPPGDLGVQNGNPEGKFVISDGTLYGTGYESYDYPDYPWYGVIFSVGIDGTSQFLSGSYDFEPLFGDGTQPDGVILSDGLLYGVTHSGGPFGHGTVYVYDGSTVTYLHSFAGGDGATPVGSLVLSNGTLYGVTQLGGSWGKGTVYSINSDGTGFRVLHHFTGPTNGEGAYPPAALILSGDTLFGTTSSGGTSGGGTAFGGAGTVFSVSIDGTGFRTLYNFTGGNDGAKPASALTISSNALYGTTSGGGTSGLGTVFAVQTDGGGFTNLHSFSGIDGASPAAEMILSGNTLYGTTYDHGKYGRGTVFSLSLSGAPPQLTIAPSSLNVVLTWATNGAFFLQSTTSLVSPTVWTRFFPAPVVVNGLNTVTSPISGGQQFFRLSQ